MKLFLGLGLYAVVERLVVGTIIKLFVGLSEVLLSVHYYYFRAFIGWFENDVGVRGKFSQGPAFHAREIIWDISRGPKALQGPSVLSDELMCQGVECQVRWFPVGWVNERGGLSVRSMVKIVNDFKSSMKVV